MSRRSFLGWLCAKAHSSRLWRRAPARHRALRFEPVEFRHLLATLTLNPAADNTIFQSPAGNSDGIGPDLYAGETERGFGARRALLKFDVAGNIPAGARINSATLQLHVSHEALAGPFTVGAHLLNTSWGEGTSNSGEPGGSGVAATASDATWIDRFFGSSPEQKWASAGGDFKATASATTSVSGLHFYQWNGAQMAADVQGWLDTPSTQFGWLIKVEDETKLGSAQRFDSRESFTPANRPTLTINYTLPNLPPTLDPIADPPGIPEGAGPQTINLTNISAGPGETQSLMVTAASDNITLIPTPSVSYTSPNSTGSLQYTPVSDRFGSAKIAVTVRDAGSDGVFNNGDDATFAQTFTVTVTPVNDPPTLTSISDPAAILEDSSLQTINLSGISAGPFESQTITIIATSDNSGLIPTPTVNYTSPNSTGTLTYKSVANQSGQAVITIRVQDDGGTVNNGLDTLIRTFTVNVTPVNDPPTLDSIANPPAILENATEQTLDLTGITAGLAESGQTLVIDATSSNPGLIPAPAVTYTSPNDTGTLSYQPIADQSGVAIITVKIRDGGGTANNGSDEIVRTFAINVTPVNDPPTLAAIDNPSPILESSGQQTIPLEGISAGPSETQVLTITAKSDNPALIADPVVNYTSPFSTGSLTYTPTAHRFGVANITVTVKDNGGTLNNGIDIVTRTFAVVVNEVNDPPTLDAVTDPQSVAENSNQQTLNLTGISAGPFESQDLSIIATSDNPTLLPDLAIHYFSPNSTGSLTYTPAAGHSGSAVITITVRDAGLDGVLNDGDDAIIERSFTIRVLSPDEINHAPSFNAGTVQPVTDETGAVTLPGFATNISAGPAQESQQTVAFTLSVSSDEQKLFSIQPEVDSNGQLTFTPAPNAHGTAHITIQAKDNGGTAVGGVDTSPPQAFAVVITKPHIWHNTRNARDVDDDHFVVAQDVITIINRINARGSGKIPDDATFGPPYYDVDNDDNVVAQDVINIINFINAGRGGAGEASSIGSDASRSNPMATDAVFQSLGVNLLALTLSDIADSALEPRRK